LATCSAHEQSNAAERETPDERRYWLFLHLSFPGLEGAGLESAAIGEGEHPGLDGVEGVDGIQVDTGLFLALATREEENSWNCWRDGPLQDLRHSVSFKQSGTT
jgi:hypothetical protein